LMLSTLFYYRYSYIRLFVFFFSSRRRHTRSKRDWSSDVCSSDLDDSFLSTSFPGVNLTTIEHPKEEMGKKAAQWIISSIENPELDRKSVVFPSELIIRNSTKSLKKTEKVVE